MSQQYNCMSHQGPLEVPAGCLLSGLDLAASQRLGQLTLTNDIIIQGHRIELGNMKLMVYTVIGAKDDLQVRSHSMFSHSYTITSHLFSGTANEQMNGVSFHIDTKNWLKSTKEIIHFTNTN